MAEDIKKIMEEIGSNSKVAYERLSTASNEEKNDALHLMANEIEDNENAQFLNKISSISKSKIDDKLINELMENYSLSDLAKSLVSLYKSNLAPIEDIENLDLSPKKEFKRDKFNSSKSNNNKTNFKRKRRRRRK